MGNIFNAALGGHFYLNQFETRGMWNVGGYNTRTKALTQTGKRQGALLQCWVVVLSNSVWSILDSLHQRMQHPNIFMTYTDSHCSPYTTLHISGKLIMFCPTLKLNKIWLAFMSSSEKNVEFCFPEYCYLSIGNFRTEPIKYYLSYTNF